MKFYYSKAKVWKSFAFILGLLCLGAVLSQSQIGLYCIAGVLVVALWQAITTPFNKEPILVIDEQGILDNSTSGYGLIPWADITLLEVTKANVGGVLTIHVVDKGKYIKQMSLAQRLFEYLETSDINIYFLLITPNLKDAWEYLRVTHADKTANDSFEHPRKLRSFSWKLWAITMGILLVLLLVSMYR